MLELIFLVFVIPSRIRRAARPRGKSVLRWSLLAVGSWIGTELVVGTLVLLGVTVCNLAFGVPSQEIGQVIVLVGYLAGVALGMFAAGHVQSRLEGLPLITEITPEKSAA